MTIIECFGLPGAGKSYIQEQLVIEFNKRGIAALDRLSGVTRGLVRRSDSFLMSCIKKLPSFIWQGVVNKDLCLQEFLDFSGKNPRYFELVLSNIQETSVRPDHRRSIIGAIATTCIEFTICEQNLSIGEVLVADEWFCHRYHTVFGNCGITPDKNTLVEYVAAMPLADVGIFIATPPLVCLQRMEERKRFPHYLANLTSENVVKSLDLGNDNFIRLVQALEKTSMKMIKYDGVSPDISEIVQKCIDHVRQES